MATRLRSPPIEWASIKIRMALLNSLQLGPVPDHVAFIMDGNRRFARQHQIETIEGHARGSETFVKTLSYCYDSGIRCVTLYAFSIENFKRSKQEVDALFDMANLKLTQICEGAEVLDHFGVRIQFFGDLSLLHDTTQESMMKCVEKTKGNVGAILNICAPYTSREEMTRAIRNTVCQFTSPAVAPPPRRGPFSESQIARNARASILDSVAEEEGEGEGAEAAKDTSHSSVCSSPPTSVFDHGRSEDGKEASLASPLFSSASSVLDGTSGGGGSGSSKWLPDPNSITVDTIDDNMYSAGCPPVDLLIRTSGVNRLSDFLLWQCHETTDIVVLETLWPSFGFWDFFKVILEWQWKRRSGKGDVRLLRPDTSYSQCVK